MCAAPFTPSVSVTANCGGAAGPSFSISSRSRREATEIVEMANRSGSLSSA